MNLSLFVFLMLLLPDLGSGLSSFNISDCFKKPDVRFPFGFTDAHTKSYPGFHLSCSEHDPVLKLPDLVQLHVKSIDYKAQKLSVRDPGDCLARFAKNFSLSTSPFEFQEPNLSNYTFFNCSPGERSDSQMIPVPCLGAPGYEVYAVGAASYVSNLP
ncbi:hypothetical protein K2173_013042 [Erythroxylum novogranatense]|uniref:RING-type E3 ubiquitin transferase n=1 Tax=Erythroxylum novogranatense TaxID=1862640 RepID=A0AAV8S710_9ROSI|nr:hypothetical protein K2173_013042 [Erythroxylum novogranatense]